MTPRAHLAAALAAAVLAGLGAPACRASHEAPRAMYRPPPEFDWASRRGRCVVAEGFAHGGFAGKDPPQMRSGTMSVGIVFDDGEARGDEWAPRHSPRIRVRGVVGQRADLPVFVQKPGGPQLQGIPVPEGTDLEAASRRWVIEHASVEVVRPAAQVEAALMAEVGDDVNLVGVVWSCNGFWWFEHDGVQIHLERHETIPDFGTLHASPATLHGRLRRRRLPRIDQRCYSSQPEMADAFLLEVRGFTPAPEWPVTDCP
jgi:hypothetical protein